MRLKSERALLLQSCNHVSEMRSERGGWSSFFVRSRLHPGTRSKSKNNIAVQCCCRGSSDALASYLSRPTNPLPPSHSVYPSSDSRRSRLFMQRHRSGIVSAMSGTRARAACFVVCQRLTRFYRVLSVICPRAARSCFRPPTSLNTRCDILARQLFWPLDRRDSDVWYGIWGLGIACESRVELC